MNTKFSLLFIFGLIFGSTLFAQTYTYTIHVKSATFTGNTEFGDEEFTAVFGGASPCAQAVGDSGTSFTGDINAGTLTNMAGSYNLTFGYEAWESDDITADCVYDAPTFGVGDDYFCSGTYDGAFTLSSGLLVGNTVAVTNTANSCSDTDGGITINTVELRITSVLPVNLLSFDGEIKNKSIALYWETVTEENNEYMSIERSVDGEKFTEIGQVNGYGTTNEIQKYNFIDESPVDGDNFYRLCQVDFDGTKTYHKMIRLSYNNNENVVVTARVFPNPTSRYFTVDWSGGSETNTTNIMLYDINGRIVAEHQIEAGMKRKDIDLEGLPTGVYVIHFQQGTHLEVLRIHKLSRA